MSTLRVAVAAIKAAHDSKGIEFDTGHVALRKFFQGLRRKRPEAQIQAAPLRADVLVEVISSLGSSRLRRAMRRCWRSATSSPVVAVSWLGLTWARSGLAMAT